MNTAQSGRVAPASQDAQRHGPKPTTLPPVTWGVMVAAIYDYKTAGTDESVYLAMLDTLYAARASEFTQQDVDDLSNAAFWMRRDGGLSMATTLNNIGTKIVATLRGPDKGEPRPEVDVPPLQHRLRNAQ